MPAGNNGLAETMFLSTLELSHEICKNKHCTWSMAIQQYKAVWLLTGYPNKDIDKIEKQSIEGLKAQTVEHRHVNSQVAGAKILPKQILVKLFSCDKLYH